VSLNSRLESNKEEEEEGTELLHVGIAPRVVPVSMGAEDAREREPLALREVEDTLRVCGVHASLRSAALGLASGG